MKKNFSRYASVFLTALMLLSLAACGKTAEPGTIVLDNPKFVSSRSEVKDTETIAAEKEASEKDRTAEGSASEAAHTAVSDAAAASAPDAPDAAVSASSAVSSAVSSAASSSSAVSSAVSGSEKTQSEPAPGRSLSAVTADLIKRAAVMQIYSNGKDDAPEITEQDDNILLLVNKYHPLAKNYKPDDMVPIEKYMQGVGSEETHQMRKVAAEALLQLFAGAEADGFDLRLRTGYRSYDYQNTLYSGYVKKNGQAAADRYSAKPGKSEHQTGLCCDVGVNGVSLTDFNNTKEAVWVAEHAHEYGFILRYPADKEELTGYMYESWHIRYVGVAAATEIKQQSLCLEEYLGVLPE